jgi:glycerol-3-phosphate acyltransferase PlsY
MISLQDIIIFLAAYLLGSIPFSVVVGKVFFKTDVRKLGSGNPGATNTLRTLGPKAGLSVLALDIFKGFAGVLLAKYFGKWPDVSVQDRMTIAGAFAITGHIFSPFLGFKGGKGVATTIGVIIALEPILALAVIFVFTIVLWLSRYVSLSSICSAFAFTILTLLFRTEMYIPMIFSICVTLLIVLKHKDNIIRLMKGAENRFVFRKKAS